MLYRWMAIFVIIALTTVSANAFWPDIHESITEEALPGLFWIWSALPTSPTLQGHWFSPEAVHEIVLADAAKDYGNCAPSGKPAEPCEIWGSQTITSVKFAEFGVHPEHFDNEMIEEGNVHLMANRQRVINALRSGNAVVARTELGGALHAVQDFYAHSNWVELGNTSLDHRLGELTFKSGLPRLASVEDQTCNELGFVITDPDGPLSSGYFPDENPAVGMGKCKHGGIIPGGGGLNKDYPGRDGHAMARKLAVCHTMKFVMGLLGDKSLTYDMIVDLMGGGFAPQVVQTTQPCDGDMLIPPIVSITAPAIGAIVKNSVTVEAAASDNGGVAGVQFKVDGVNIGAEDTFAPFSVQWDSSKTLNGPHTLMAAVRDYTGARSYDSVTVTVTNTISTLQCQCDAVTPHAHDPAWFDVIASRWNDTGMFVKAGDSITIRVQPNALVVWRTGLTGMNTAPPRGDPRVNPGNTLLWIDPPMANVPIGALIGAVWDPATPKDPPPPERLFNISDGGRSFKMPADGNLFLAINDGSFINNRGCFQVVLTRN